MREHELAFLMRKNLKIIYWFFGLLITFILLIIVIGAGYAYIQAQSAPQQTQIYKQTNNNGNTTDLYASSIISALNCFKRDDYTNCNYENQKSNMLTSITNNTLTINGETHPITTPESIHQTITQNKTLQALNLQELTTEENNNYNTTILYTSEQGNMTLTFTTKENGDIKLTNITTQITTPIPTESTTTQP